MTTDEGTQTNGVAEPGAGQLTAKEATESAWTVQSGMS